jgi:hypothetical protein
VAGYSGTPLIKKLGIKDGTTVLFENAPAGFGALLGELPDGVRCASEHERDIDFAITFMTDAELLSSRFEELPGCIKTNGMIWIAWPKRSSGVRTDLNENVVREIGLATGMVDVKVCAIDEVWSGLKFVIRKSNRPGRKQG